MFGFDLIVFLVCCVDVNSELGYRSPGEYARSNETVFERAWHYKISAKFNSQGQKWNLTKKN